MMARLAVIAIAFLVGHAVLMTVSAQPTDLDSHTDHHAAAVEVCVAADAVATQAPGIPLLPIIAIPAIAVAIPVVTDQVASSHTSLFAIDGATQRALLQVFLN